MTVDETIAAVSVPATGTIREALRSVDAGGIGVALLLGDDGTFAGLVTDGDLRRALLAGLGLESPLAAVSHPEAVVATAAMTQEELAALLNDRVHVVPILDDARRVVDLAVFDRRLRLPVAAPLLGERELLYVTECVLTGWISSAGRFVSRFEEVFAEFLGVRHAIATSNGTTALHLALLASGVGPGDEVIVPSLTFVATANAVTYTGATPVLVDSDPATWTLDAGAVEAAVTPRTRAIVPVHLYGHPARMDAILESAARHGLAVVEDAAEAHGARFRGSLVGGLGDAGVFSFYGNKIVTTGEGGMVVTDRDEVAERVRMLRDHGMSRERRYWHPEIGFNYRLTNLQAAVGVAQMERVDEILAAKRAAAARYRAGLEPVPGITLPPAAPWADSVNWLFTVLVDSDEFGLTRGELTVELESRGVETRPVFTPVHRQPPYDRNLTLPVAEHVGETGLSLPSAVSLTDAQIDRVVAAVAESARSPTAASA